MMLKCIRKLLTAGLAGFMVSMTMSCYSPLSDEDSASYAVVELTNGTVFTFTLPTTGNSELCAKSTTSHSDSAIKMYSVTGLSASDIPYDSFTLELIPTQTTASGEKVSASATLTVVSYSASTDSTQIDTNYYPKSRVFYLNAKTDFNTADYDAPGTTGGTLCVNWSVDDDYAVLPDATYTDYVFKTYSVKSVKVHAKVVE